MTALLANSAIANSCFVEGRVGFLVDSKIQHLLPCAISLGSGVLRIDAEMFFPSSYIGTSYATKVPVVENVQ